MSYTPSPSPPRTPPTSDSECEESPTRINQLHTQSPIPTPSHPFAASSKADRAPPVYEKKPFTPPTTPPCPKKFSLSSEVICSPEDKTQAARLSIQHSRSLADEEQKRWDATISSAIDKAETKIDLSNAGLSYIPSSIIDLKALVVLGQFERHTISTSTAVSATASTRTFMRSTTAPALLPSSRVRPFLPSHTTNGLAFGAAKQQRDLRTRTADRNRCEVQLYLMRNAIRMLPRELFTLECLVVLSLRQNKLTLLPPAICKLTRLRELNVANNRLSYLPAEIQRLQLASLHLFPNSFIPPPLDVSHAHKLNTETALQALGPLKRGPSVPALTELALRRLLSPVTPASPTSETCLEAAMTLAEIDALHLPLHIKRVVRASTGHGRARVTDEGACVEAQLDITMNVCPCPGHRLQAESGPGSKKSVRFAQTSRSITKGMFDRTAPVFGMPVEERMEWVGMVAGVQVSESPSAWVPLLWRGCGPGCLDFLEDRVINADDKSDHTFEFGNCVEGEEFEFSDDERDTVLSEVATRVTT